MRSRFDSALLFVTAMAAGAFLGARAPGEIVRARLLAPFELHGIAARGLEQVRVEEVARAAGVAPGTPLAAIHPGSVEERLRSHPWIRGARVAAIPPGRLLVDVEERVPTALAELGHPPRLRVLDATGEAFLDASEDRDWSLPRLHVGSGAEALIAGRVRDGLGLLERLAANGLPPAAEVWLAEGDEEGVVVRLAGDGARVVLGGPPFDPKLVRLRRLREASRPEAKTAMRIDLRFADRVVLGGDPSSTKDAAGAARAVRPSRTGSRSG